jgi:ribosome-associated toxin RatA of RatAB toxin-antitoxin module
MKTAVIVLAVVVLAGATFALEAPPFSAQDRRRLEQREILLFDDLPPGAPARSAMGGTAVALVHADAEAVWRLLVDYPGHSSLYPRVVHVDVLERGGDHALVRYVVGVGPFSFGFHVDNYADRARGRLAWRLAHDRRNNLFRDSWGYWQIEPAVGGVVVTYAMAARTILPTFLTRGAERDGLVQTLSAVRDRAEGLAEH